MPNVLVGGAVIELSVAVVTTAIVLPLGVYLGAAWERARAELRRPPAPHVILTEWSGPLGLRSVRDGRP